MAKQVKLPPLASELLAREKKLDDDVKIIVRLDSN